MRSLRDAQGRPFVVGRELGRGGEGSVFDVPGAPGKVAKLYHEIPDGAKQDKLKLMAAGIDDRLRRYAAWPEATLHRDTDGAVVGFTMQRIERRWPIHMLYSPAQRREQFPKARWDFLLFVARNTAAAFDTLHDHGHVLGDVNQGNVLVGEDSQVMLIDCDSFQIRFGEALHRCEVGVAHFTPPELQTLKTFEGFTRSANHDCFGLALLIFHLLMGGRHPFSGVPQSERVGNALEADIRDFRYAYARDARHRLLLPPPKSVPIATLPSQLVNLFEQAFTESGRQSRPTASQWVAALDAVRGGLKTCTKNPAHTYSNHLTHCVWCELEGRHVNLFGSTRKAAASSKAVVSQFDLRGLRAKMAALPRPELLSAPPLKATQSILSTGLRYRLGGEVTIFLLVVLPVLLLIWGSHLNGMFGALGMILAYGIIVGAIMFGIHDQNRLKELAREAAWNRLRSATIAVQHCVDEANRNSGAVEFDKGWQALHAALEDYELKLDRIKADGAQTQATVLRQFLGQQLIEKMGDARVSMIDRIRLRSLGIETAADFDRVKLAKLHFNQPLVLAALHEWKERLIREFRTRQPASSRAPASLSVTAAKQMQALERNIQELFDTLLAELSTGKALKPKDRHRFKVLLEAQRFAHEDYQKEVLK